MSSNRRQHWVPRAYLRGFADGERLRVFARMDGPGAREFETSIDGVANERDLYSVTTETGRDNGLDDAIRSDVEDNLPQTLAPVIEGRDLTTDEWMALVRLAGAQDMRGPSAIHNLTETLTKVMEYTGILYRQHVPGIGDDEIKGRFRHHWGAPLGNGTHALDPKNLAVGLLQSTINFTGQFGGMYPCIIESAAHDFLTSDYPVKFHDPKNLKPHPLLGIDRSAQSVEVTFPLTRRHVLFLARIPLARYVYANQTGVTLLNSRVAFGAHKQTYGYPVSDVVARTRQRRDIFRTMGILPLAPMLLSLDGEHLDPSTLKRFSKMQTRVRILSASFIERRVTASTSA